MKKNIVGMRANSCPMCRGDMAFIKIKGLGTISQCRKCSNTVSGRMKDELQIYTYDFKEEK